VLFDGYGRDAIDLRLSGRLDGVVH
jgi:hypothetical protein